MRESPLAAPSWWFVCASWSSHASNSHLGCCHESHRDRYRKFKKNARRLKGGRAMGGALAKFKHIQQRGFASGHPPNY
jgi:hypothetical protein